MQSKPRAFCEKKAFEATRLKMWGKTVGLRTETSHILMSTSRYFFSKNSKDLGTQVWKYIDTGCQPFLQCLWIMSIDRRRRLKNILQGLAGADLFTQTHFDLAVPRISFPKTGSTCCSIVSDRRPNNQRKRTCQPTPRPIEIIKSLQGNSGQFY